MSETPLVLSVHLNLPDDCTPEEKEEALSQLRQELLETDAQSVENPASGSAPPGAKGLPPGIDALLVTLSHSGAVLGSVLGAITSWTASRSGSVTVFLAVVVSVFPGHHYTLTKWIGVTAKSSSPTASGYAERYGDPHPGAPQPTPYP